VNIVFLLRGCRIHHFQCLYHLFSPQCLRFPSLRRYYECTIFAANVGVESVSTTTGNWEGDNICGREKAIGLNVRFRTFGAA
jgi:hypothetical protein